MTQDTSTQMTSPSGSRHVYMTQAEGRAFITTMPNATNTPAVVCRVPDSAEKRRRLEKEAQVIADKKRSEQKRARGLSRRH